MRKEEIEKEFLPLLKDIADYGEEYFDKHTNEVIDKIVSRDTAMLEEIENPLRAIKTLYSSKGYWGKGTTDADYEQEAIDEALSIIQRIRGDK
jgi:hypothetical protein